MDIISKRANGIVFEVVARPGNKTSGVDGLISNRVEIRLAAKAVDGAASLMLRELLSERLQLSKSSVTLLSGETSRQKTIFVTGNAEQLSLRLQEVITWQQAKP